MIVLNLPQEAEERLLAEAERLNVSVEEYLLEHTCMTSEVCVRRTPPIDSDAEKRAPHWLPQPAAV